MSRISKRNKQIEIATRALENAQLELCRAGLFLSSNSTRAVIEVARHEVAQERIIDGLKRGLPQRKKVKKK